MTLAQTTFKGRTENQNKTVLYCRGWCIPGKEVKRVLIIIKEIGISDYACYLSLSVVSGTVLLVLNLGVFSIPDFFTYFGSV